MQLVTALIEDGEVEQSGVKEIVGKVTVTAEKIVETGLSAGLVSAFKSDDRFQITLPKGVLSN